MLTRSKNNPILKPNPKNFWESKKVYNPAAFYEDSRYYLFYRAIGSDWISRIGLAISPDGENFSRFDKPVLEPVSELESKGVEDPRITKINKTYYLTYTAYDGLTARLSLAVSNDLKNWQRRGVMLPNWDYVKAGGFILPWDKARSNPQADQDWIKAGGIFPKIINGKYYMLFGGENLWLASSTDGLKWQPILEPFLRPRPDYFDSVHLEMGPAPIATEQGWLAIYHGIDQKRTYRLGFLLLDLNDPAKILYRSDQPIFAPTEPYELSGLVDVLPGGLAGMQKMSPDELDNFIKEATAKKIMPRVVFCCGAVLVGGILKLYYGAGDSVIGMAEAPLNDLLNLIK
ncbi:MAG: hypothetical protein V1684_01020 [bacterium]